jgi:hypothetical protein
MPKLMVLEETTKYDSGKHYTRKEGRQGRSEGGREALQQFGGVQMALATQLWTQAAMLRSVGKEREKVNK